MTGIIDYQVAPGCGIMKVSGKWELAGEGKIKVAIPKKSFTLEIVSCDEEVLSIKRTEEK